MLSSSQHDTEPSSPLPSARRPRRRRLFVEVDADEESECEAVADAKRRKTKQGNEDPDFEMEDTHSLPDSNASMDVNDEDDAVLDEIDAVDVNDDDEQSENPPAQGTTLASFEFCRGEGLPKEMPRDKQRRKRFTHKIGRLEKDSFFLRRTGGGGDGEPPKSKSKVLKYTPLETQIVKLRKQHPDKLLVVECGYKYRMFAADATAASKTLRVASFFDHNFLTASFPTHRLGHHVRRLVHAGYKVGVVSQSETAALKKASNKSSSLFERRLTAVYTKGTITADGKLSGPISGGGGGANACAATYIMSIAESEDPSNDESSKSQNIAIAAVDSATGEVFFDTFTDDVLRSDLESRLVAIEPVEILMMKKPSSKATEMVVKAYCESMNSRLERLSSSNFVADCVLDNLRNSVGSAEKSKDSHSTVLSCLGALVEYLKQFNLELSMSSATEYKSFRSNRQMRIGADVLRNFEVFGNSNNGAIDGSLIGLVNRTKTAFGSRQMRQWLSHPLINPQDICDRLDAVDYLRTRVDGNEAMYDDSELVENAIAGLIKSLSGLPDLEQGLTRISCHKCTPAEFIIVLNAIEEVGKKIDHIKSFTHSSSFPPLLAKLFSSTPVVSEALESAIIQVLNKKAASDNRYFELFGGNVPVVDALKENSSAVEFIEISEELAGAMQELENSQKEMTKLLRKLRQVHSRPAWEWKKVAQEEYLLEVPVSKVSSMPRSWTVVSQTKAVKRLRPPEADRGYEKVLCARETVDDIAARCWQSYLQLFTSITTPLRAVVRTLVNLDCLSALARVANLPGYVKPEVDKDQSVPAGLLVENARHPLTELLPTCTSYVPNDVHLGRGAHEIAVIISGPNYGGKSSYARMTALIAMLIQIGCYVPASSAKLSPFDAIHARMGSTDSMSKGMSSLMVELAETSRILSTATSRSLVVLDELGRGTSTHDGTAVAYATLSHLVGKTGCSTLFVTHYPMLATLREIYPKHVKAFFMNYLEEEDLQNVSGQECHSEAENKPTSAAKKAKITFLYKLVEGVASSSYGLNVASLAGIPTDVIEMAHSKASELELKLDEVKRENNWARLMGEGAWRNEDTIRKTLVDGSIPR